MNFFSRLKHSVDAERKLDFCRLIDDAQRFKEHEYEVTRKDGLVFLREMAAEVKNFMDFKMNAVMVSSREKYSFFYACRLL